MEFKDLIQETMKETTAYSFGDQRMYEMMDTVYDSRDTMEIASMIWLIGRSYAASPERIHKKVKDPAVLFVELAESIKDLVFDEALSRNAEYRYDGSDYDVNMLVGRTRLVNNMNNVRLQLFEDGDAVNNMISFCSKFLHFCMPKTVFIIDQYSLAGSNRLFAKIHTQTARCSVQVGITIEDIRNSMPEEYVDMYGRVKKRTEVFTSELSETDRKAIKEYSVHTCGCYVLAAYINSIGVEMAEERGSMPRLVDSVLMKMGKAG